MPDPVRRTEPVPATAAVYLCLLLGRILFNFGATTQRIQDSIACLARYLGCKVELLVSYDALLVTVEGYRTAGAGPPAAAKDEWKPVSRTLH